MDVSSHEDRSSPQAGSPLVEDAPPVDDQPIPRAGLEDGTQAYSVLVSLSE
jgi:hypothetical protein